MSEIQTLPIDEDVDNMEVVNILYDVKEMYRKRMEAAKTFEEKCKIKHRLNGIVKAMHEVNLRVPYKVINGHCFNCGERVLGCHKYCLNCGQALLTEVQENDG